ncbi:hypothetical protein [Bacillus sp. NPDC094106]|uniref:hypothetical protein n=1 Tax=Bacillus sp. NPDC094106 TaxID=3363949 RepID=UPI00382FA135
MRDLFLIEVKHDEFMYDGTEFRLFQESKRISGDQFLAYAKNCEEVETLMKQQSQYYFELPKNALPGDFKYQSRICSVVNVSDDGGSPLLQSFSRLDSFLFEVAKGESAVIKMR